jgi:hypothetical protein
LPKQVRKSPAVPELARCHRWVGHLGGGRATRSGRDVTCGKAARAHREPTGYRGARGRAQEGGVSL